MRSAGMLVYAMKFNRRGLNMSGFTRVCMGWLLVGIHESGGIDTWQIMGCCGDVMEVWGKGSGEIAVEGDVVGSIGVGAGRRETRGKDNEGGLSAVSLVVEPCKLNSMVDGT